MKRFMIATFTDLILRVVCATILSRTGLQSTGIWTAWPIGWSVGTIISMCFYRQIKRKQQLLASEPTAGQAAT
jgi:Na+-driven multidrug efflux pump